MKSNSLMITSVLLMLSMYKKTYTSIDDQASSIKHSTFYFFQVFTFLLKYLNRNYLWPIIGKCLDFKNYHRLDALSLIVNRQIIFNYFDCYFRDLKNLIWFCFFNVGFGFQTNVLEHVFNFGNH